MASDEMLQAITKHVTGAGKPQEFSQLKERFEGHGYMLPSAAAALGYLIAKDELEAAKKEEEEPDVYDEVVAIINRFDNQRVNSLSPHSATDQIFTLIYKWLDDELAAKGWPLTSSPVRAAPKELFRPFVIQKPEA